MPEIISREQAKSRGLNRYFTGKKCRRGHKFFRAVKSSHCMECINERNVRRRTGGKIGGRWCDARQLAIKEGKSRYFNGKTCKHGHIAERLTSNSTCIPCGNFISRKSAANNSTKIRMWKSVYYQQNLELIRAQHKEYSRQNADAACRRAKKWYRENLDYVRQRDQKWREKNAEAIKEYKKNHHLFGAKDPKGARQWLTKSKAILRTTKRILRNRRQEVTNSPEART